MSNINISPSPSPSNRYAEGLADESIAGRSKVGKIATPVGVPEALPNGLPGVDGLDETLTAPEPSTDFLTALNGMSLTLASMNSDQGVMDLYAVMELIAVTAQSQRTAAREVREADYRVQTEMQYAAASKIREGASIRFWGAIANAGIQIAGGAMMVGGAFAKPQLEGQLQSNWDRNLALIGHLGRSGGDFGKATESIVSSFAADADAQKAELEAAASRRGQMANEANEVMDSMYQSIRDALEKLKSIESSRQDTNRSISRNV